MERLFYWFLEDTETKEIIMEHTVNVFLGDIGETVHKDNKLYTIKDYAEEWINY